MNESQRIVRAATYLTWYEHLEAIVAEDPREVAPGGSQPAVLLLLELVSIGVRQGAVLPIVTHNTGPLGFAHVSFRYPVNRNFDWDGKIEMMPETDLAAAQLEQLILELETATGVMAR